MSAEATRLGQSTGYEFASPQYLAMVHGYLIANAPVFAQKLGTRRLAMCEVYTGVPAEVSPFTRVSLTWSIGGDVPLSFSLSEHDDVDMKLVGTWEVLRQLARTPFTAETAEVVDGLFTQAAAAGELTMTSRGRVPGFVRTMHNDLATWIGV